MSDDDEYGYEYDESNLRLWVHAAMKGYLNVIEFLHNNGIEIDSNMSTNVMDEAAKYGQLDVIKWLHKNRTEGCSSLAMYYAVKNGHLETVNFLNEFYPMKYDKLTLAFATSKKSSSLKILKTLLYSKNSKGDVLYSKEDVFSALKSAIEKNNLEALKLLCEKTGEQCNDKHFILACERNKKDIVQYLYEECGIGKITMDLIYNVMTYNGRSNETIDYLSSKYQYSKT
jgi:hypothetical protein